MSIHSVHTRELEATPERVERLLESLGSDHDELWPIDRWPTNRLWFDPALEVGARGGHGPIRYSVEEHEPCHRLIYRFDPGQGIDGTHGFEVQPREGDRTRLSHTLDCRLSGMTRLLSPVLIRQHDALLEDLLDRAELLTSGRLERPNRHSLLLRLVNWADERVTGRLGRRRGRSGLARLAGVAVPGALAGIAALHAAWALGWHWPGGSEEALAERVISSSSSELPPDAAIWGVAGLLLGAAGLVRAASTGAAAPVIRGGAWTVSAVLLSRGVAGLAVDVANGFDGVYAQLDAAIYSPLCLALGAGTVAALGGDGSLPARAAPAG